MPVISDETYPPATTAVYATPTPNTSIPLYRGRLRVTKGADTDEGEGAIEFRWLPTQQIVFSIPALVHPKLGLDDCKLELLENGWSHQACIVHRGYGGMGGLVYQAEGQWTPSADGATHVAQLRLHVPNFLETGGDPLSPPSGNGWYAGRIQLDIDPWKLTLDALGNSIREPLKRCGGFAFTHTLACERWDGAPFEPKVADEFMSQLDLVLSFCLGRWTGCMLTTGHSSKGDVLWEHWRQPLVSSYRPGWSWFPDHHSDVALKALLLGFARACQEPVVRRAIGNCVHWYIEANANHGGLEGSIVMALVALELLAWLELVNRVGMSSDGFEKVPAHDKIRLYLKAKGIPCTPVPDLPDLASFIQSEPGCADSVEALTRIRNRTVHPPKKSGFKDHSFELLEQAWRYSLYLLERSILAEASYASWFRSRLSYGWPYIELKAETAAT
jgi:hypothetical protein